MQIVTVPLPQLGNRCHLLHDGSQGIVVDPPRDHTVVEEAAEEAGVEIRAVADTHVHNDYVSGAALLARRHGADYLVSAAELVAVPHVGVRSGDVVEVGGLAVEVLHAPGHTEHHQAFLVGTAPARPRCSPAAACSTAPSAAPTWSRPTARPTSPGPSGRRPGGSPSCRAAPCCCRPTASAASALAASPGRTTAAPSARSTWSTRR